jgi:hypothetical protein
MAWCALLLALAGNVDVELSLSDGSRLTGHLGVVTSEQVVIEREGQQQEFPIRQLSHVRFQTRSTVPQQTPVMEAVLTDGSRLMLGNFHSSKGLAVLDWLGESAPLSIPERSLQSVRLQPLEGALLQSWETMRRTPTRADVVVIQKDNQLRQVEGLIGGLDDVSVKFQFDGQWIDVRREKVAGLLYLTPAAQLRPSRAQLTTLDGSRLELLDFQRAADSSALSLATPNATQLSVALDRIQQLDFAALSTVYLSDVEADPQQVTPYVQVAAIAEAQQKWFAPQADRRVSRQPLVIRGEGTEQSFAKGLGLHSRTELGYRLAGQFRRFLATAFVDETGGPGRVTLVISADGAERFRETLAVGDAPREIDLDLSGVNRLQILVDYGDQSDQGDQLSLCDARFLK